MLVVMVIASSSSSVRVDALVVVVPHKLTFPPRGPASALGRSSPASLVATRLRRSNRFLGPIGGGDGNDGERWSLPRRQKRTRLGFQADM